MRAVGEGDPDAERRGARRHAPPAAFYADINDGSPWGVGWLNNPVNPRYPADRNPFLETFYHDAAEPQKWPYPEKVMGWAGHPVELIETPGELVSGYRAAWWLTNADRANVRPPVHQFCDESNQCYWPNGHLEPDAPGLEDEPAGPCAHKNSDNQYDLKCWYHQRTQWIDDCRCIVPGTDPLCSSAIDDQMAGVGLMVDNVERAIRAKAPNASRHCAPQASPSTSPSPTVSSSRTASATPTTTSTESRSPPTVTTTSTPSTTPAPCASSWT
ncbi:hypothetical protein AB0C27_21895 [Nonomuraea sp. NPDC048882]|uniref:hypothetical protein n=1 Tax=Nonomuraea sp. NPDC048882 TaxID=3154347 RepID=UPI0033C818CA